MKYKGYAVSAYHLRVFLLHNLDRKKFPISFPRRVAHPSRFDEAETQR